MPDTPGKRQRREVQARRRMEKSAKRVARRAHRLDPNAYQELRPSDEGGYREQEEDGNGEARPDTDEARPDTDEGRPDDERSPHPAAGEQSPQPGESP